MNIFKIAYKNLINKPLTNGLSILLMALGVGIVTLIITIGKKLEEKFTKNIKGIDMVVGAKGSPLQLILSSIYQIDAPTGNISYSEAKVLSKNPYIKKAIPISMGDSYLGYRIVGTDSSYLSHYQAVIAKGHFFKQAKECVIGSEIATKLGLKLGDEFASAHGLDNEGEKHKEDHYKVVGILAYNNSVVDQLIITPLESIWEVHEHDNKGSNTLSLIDESIDNEQDKQITSLLVKFRNPMGLMTIPRNINANTTMQAALPAIEINRLFALLGVGIDALKWIAMLIILVSALSVFVTLFNSLKERKYELALMLTMGGTRFRMFTMLLLEGLYIGILGYILGLLLGKIGLLAMSKAAEQNFHYSFDSNFIGQDEILILIGCLLISLLAAAIPSIGIYRINISKTLADQ
jgi:putative ABC transport system permease protein